ncbi:hypothetical protein A0H81_11271 [Grifola frondosa]|uniref:Uncharacterized protein n=1 Tax=Grifola frondosa TaxID=5627 RepID=A0A1C7LW97_GRIFR|nr:hypothetical protein A0H81_11271 [Grifola frondosa]
MNPHFVVSITTLELSSVTFGTILDLHLILCALPHLSDLLLRRCDWNDMSICETFRPTDNPLFQSLKISPVEPSHLSLLASWLPGTQAGHALKDLHAHIPSHKFYAPLNQLIAAVHSTLELLVLFKSPSKGMHDARSGRIDLSPCKNLSHLRLNNQLKLTMEEARFFEDQVNFPLELQIVELAIQPNASETYALERIDQFFTRPQFRHLQSVILLYDQIDLTQISIGVWLGRIVRKMRRSLPRLRARGILRFGTTRMDFSGSQKAREIDDYINEDSASHRRRIYVRSPHLSRLDCLSLKAPQPCLLIGINAIIL